MVCKLSLALASVSVLSAAVPCLAQDNLSHQQLRQLFPGNFTAVVKGYVLEITALDNGTLIGRMHGLRDEGRWSLHNGRLCIMMTNWTSGKATCTTVVADNGWYRGQGVKFRKT